jgi:hypothetical protein
LYAVDALVGEAKAVVGAEAPTTATDVLRAGWAVAVGLSGVAVAGVAVLVLLAAALARPASAERVSMKPAAYTLAMAEALSATILRGVLLAISRTIRSQTWNTVGRSSTNEQGL